MPTLDGTTRLKAAGRIVPGAAGSVAELLERIDAAAPVPADEGSLDRALSDLRDDER